MIRVKKKNWVTSDPLQLQISSLKFKLHPEKLLPQLASV